jgi:peptide deformylase
LAIRKVAVSGNPVLRKVAEAVPEKDISSPKIQNLIRDMVDTMVEYDGRGLAAPQIHESLQIVVMLWDFDKESEPYLLCLINPVIKPLSEEKSTFWEGCLSLPGVRGKVARHNKISVEALSPKKEKIEFIAEGFAATVVQHECDHLLGKLYIDRMTDFSTFTFNTEYQKYFSKEESEATE